MWVSWIIFYGCPGLVAGFGTGFYGCPEKRWEFMGVLDCMQD